MIDMDAAGGANLGAVTTNLGWSATRLSFDSVTAGEFGLLVPNIANASSGSVSLAAADALGTTTSVSLAHVFFTASAAQGATTIALNPLLATSVLGVDFLGAVRVRNLDVCVAPTGPWGDVTADSVVNIIDAQQIARSSVGLSVENPVAVATQGDVNADGFVNIIDAQQVARFSVALPVAVRVNTPAFVPPDVVSLTISAVLDARAGAVNPGVPANTAALTVGSQAQIQPLARDASTENVTACTTITYHSNSPGVTVSPDGLISAITAGPASITLAAGSATVQLDVMVSAGAGRIYATDFALTEDPISEAGSWINGGVVALDWTNVSTSAGRAIGHQVGASFTDATALLTGLWGPNQSASGTVFATSQNDACYQEVELRLRSAVAPHVNTGYEIAFKSSQSSDAYLIIVRWNGALGDFTYLFFQNAATYGVKTGDEVSATVIGNVITAYKNGVQMAQVTDDTYAAGSPGIGFNLENGTPGCPGTNGDYGFTHFTATDAVVSPGALRAPRRLP